MLDAITKFISMETPATDIGALNLFAKELENYVRETCGSSSIEWISEKKDGRPHLVVRLGERTDVLLIGHFDTVHPVGTLRQNPVRIHGDRFYGPGSLDMKAGLVIMTEIARYITQVREQPNVTLVFNSDEEIGSFSSGDLLREVADGARIGLVFESTIHEGLLKIGARGVRCYQITATGKGGHVAYPEHNVNPVETIADLIVEARKWHDPPSGIVVVPTMLSGSDATNVVPHFATVTFEARGTSEARLEEVERAFYRLSAKDPQVTLAVERIKQIETFELRNDNRAFAYAEKSAELLGMAELHGVEARGASDTNQIARVLPHAMEGLGGWGDGLHDPEREHVMVSSLVPSAALSSLITEMCLDDAS